MAKALVVLGCLAAVAGLDLVRRRKRRRRRNVSEEKLRSLPTNKITESLLPEYSERKALHERGGAVAMCVFYAMMLLIWLGGWLLSEGGMLGHHFFQTPLMASHFSFFLTLLVSVFFAVRLPEKKSPRL